MTRASPLPARTRFEALDSWRGLAALIVAALHVPVAHRYSDAAPILNAQMAVDFFFVLSGFVISHASAERLRRPGDFEAFILRRVGRVWPLHVAVLGGFVALECAKLLASFFVTLDLQAAPFTGPHSPGAIVTNLLLLQSFNLHGTTTWNGPGWSISAEAFAYLVFGLTAMALGGRGSTTRRRVLVHATIALYGLAGLALLGREGLFSTHDFGVLRCLYGFFTGALVWQAWRYGAPRLLLSRRAGTALEIACLILVLFYVAQSGRGAASLAAPVFAGILIFIFALERGALSQGLKRAPFLALGRWSYSIYMTHELLFTLARIAIALAPDAITGGPGSPPDASRFWAPGSGMGDALAIAALLALVVACSAATWRFIEEPARLWFQTRADKIAEKTALGPRLGPAARRA